ncbi:hypothetical protein EMN47_08265 [Prolixibacteraceae bacterium JC049]|nr:hypothetical protein [Prolixibacteraceae bacterium JC049]
MLPLKNKIATLYLTVVAFLAILLYTIVVKESVLFAAIPAVLFIVVMAFYAVDTLFYWILFLVPLSIPLHELVPSLPYDMQLPTEPLLVGMLLFFILKMAFQGGISKQFWLHPVSLAIYFYLFWMLITTATSTMPLVSFKFLLSKLWFLATFYFIAGKIIQNNHLAAKKMVWLYTIPLLLVIAFATYRHLGYGLHDKQASYFVMNPFYKDHTSYGAILAMYIPFLTAFSFSTLLKPDNRKWAFGILLILLFAVVMSHTRAAWLSLVGGFGVWTIIKLKIRFKPLFITGLSVLLLGLIFQNQILMQLERNSDESSAHLGDHVASMTNISTDASNLERINRWKSAWEMFKDRPIFGYGPGTYQFKYAPYQLSHDRTIISTNSGDGGNAHSEYLGPMAESGVLGTVSILLLIAVVIYTAVHTYSRTNSYYIKTIVLSALVALITYYLHGFLNNFLDTDKASAPFWGFTAMIVVFDIYTRNQQKQINEINGSKNI